MREINLGATKIFEKHIQNKLTSLYIVVRYEDRMVAFAGCDFTYGPSEAHVTNIAVLPEYQHQGLGLMMLKTLQTEAKKIWMPPFEFRCQT